ncbi:Metallo-dependent phosphatase-like protein [Blakeslea trispora]|nr:Metallo-dependent phosphatase-like protein [Blakeslea trispora]
MIRAASLVVSILCLQSVLAHGLEKRQQKDAVATPNTNGIRPLVWGDVNFIHTTDTHGWLEGHVLEGSYNGDLGDLYSFTVRMKQKAKKLRKDLFIVDTGDTHDGSGLSDVTSPKGLVSQPLLANIPYDLLTIGNHELYVNEITANTVKNFIPHWKERYVASNVYFKDVHTNKTTPIGEKYTYFEGKYGTRVLAYGFLYNFKGNGNNSVVQSVASEIQQSWFNQSLTEHNPDLITVIGHVGIRFTEVYTVIKAIRAHYPTIPIAVLGGHTHIRDAVKYDDYAAGIESGRYLETIGFFSLDGVSNKHQKKNGTVTFHRRYLDQNRPTFIYHAADNVEKKFDTSKGKKISKKIEKLREQYKLSTSLGCAPQSYEMYSAPLNSSFSIFRLAMEEVIPKVVLNKDRTNPPYYIINSGSIRYEIYKGPFTLDNLYQISPFEDRFYAIHDVPLSAAKQLLAKLNGQSEVFKKRSLYHTENPIQFGEQMNFAKRAQNLTRGYVTKDDFGTDGDDTAHVPYVHYDIPFYVDSAVPKGDSSTLVDLVYFDYFDALLRKSLATITGKEWTANMSYGDPSITSSTMWSSYAQKYWNSTSC